jgi:glycosyltransferase involved in cell wall biosynthesis
MRLIYTNQVDLTERTGQGTHEKEISNLLLSDLTIEGIYVGQKPLKDHEYDHRENVFLLPLNKTFLGYFWYQIRLFFILAKLSRAKDTVIFQRYAPAMVAPALVSYFFKIPMVTRTGPVIRNLGVYGKPTNLLFKATLNLFVKFNYHVSCCLVVVTQTIKDYVLKNYNLKKNKIIISGNGFNPSIFKLDSDFASAPKDIFVFFCGSFHKDTGVDDLLEAIFILAKNMGGVRRCILAGDGPLKTELQARYKDSQCNWEVIFPGRVSQQEINHFSNQSRVGVVPFNTMALSETGSAAVKIFEYLASGTPVVATRHSDHEFIERNELGGLCNPDDPVDMAACLESYGYLESKYSQDRLVQFALDNGTWEKSYKSLKKICQMALYGDLS